MAAVLIVVAGLIVLVVVRDPDPELAGSTDSSPGASSAPSPDDATPDATQTRPQSSDPTASETLTPGSLETLPVEPAANERCPSRSNSERNGNGRSDPGRCGGSRRTPSTFALEEVLR